MQTLLLFVLVLSVSSFSAEQTSYKNFKIYSVKALTRLQAESLARWQAETGIEFWDSLRPDKYSRILVGPKQQSSFDAFLQELGIESTIVNDDVEETLIKERKVINLMQEEFSFDTYWTLEKVYTYITLLHSKYPQFIQMYDLDTTHEGRPIKSVTISLDGVIGNNPIVFIDNGIQGSDWISLMTVAYLIYQLVENSANNFDLLQNTDWVIIPITNPDGLVYSQTVDRFWSKNRVPIDENCVGVDLNSNFDSVWKPSKNPCSQAYSGTSALSEVESRSVATLMAQYASSLVSFATLNSNELLSLYQFNYDYDVLIGNWAETKPLDETIDADAPVVRHKLSAGITGAVLYLSSGNIEGHQVTVNNARISYTVETNVDSSQTFLLIPDQIINVVSKLFMGFKAMALTTVNS